MVDPKPLTRNQIAAFVGNDPEAIRAVERIFRVAGEQTPAQIDAVTADVIQATLQADSASAQVAALLGAMERLKDSVDLLALAPPRQPLTRVAWGTFFDTTTQTAAAINTAYTVSLNNTDLSRGVYLTGSPTTRVTVDQSGIYNFQHSIQLDKATGGKGLFYLWYRKNGADVADSATRVRLEGNNSESVAAWNYVFDLKAGDYIEYRWSVDNTDVQIRSFPTAAPAPATPSVIVTVTNNIEGQE